MSLKHEVVDILKRTKKERKDVIDRAVKVAESSDYTERGRTERIKEIIGPFKKKVESDILFIEERFDAEIDKITVREQEEQRKRNTTLEYQQMLATKVNILKAAIGGMTNNQIYDYVKEFENDPAAISIFNAICKEYAESTIPKEKHKLGRSLMGALPPCRYGEAARLLEHEKRTATDILQKMSFSGYALGSKEIFSAVHDKAIETEIDDVVAYFEKKSE